jgi:DNA polymerase IV
VTVSVGLARNRLIAKIAAGLDKPRGFSVIGAEASQYLAPQPVRLLPGIGPASAARLAAMGITTLGQLQALDSRTARARLGDEGPSLVARARGEDSRVVQPGREAKSISAETTFEHDIAAREELEAVLWRLCEKVARRLAENEFAAAGVTLKLRSASFATRTRAARLATPTLLPERLFDAGCRLLSPAVDGTAYRLIGIGADPLAPAADADPPDLADPSLARRVAAQRAVDTLRGKFGEAAVVRGRGLPRGSAV